MKSVLHDQLESFDRDLSILEGGLLYSTAKTCMVHEVRWLLHARRGVALLNFFGIFCNWISCFLLYSHPDFPTRFAP